MIYAHHGLLPSITKGPSIEMNNNLYKLWRNYNEWWAYILYNSIYILSIKCQYYGDEPMSDQQSLAMEERR